VAELICDRIAAGELLEQICAEEGMPARRTVNQWLDHVPAFAPLYARARARQPEVLAERAMIAAVQCPSPQMAAVNRLAFDGYRWMAARLDPSKWSDKAEVSVTIADPEATARATAQRAELIAALQRLAVSAPLTAPTIEGEPDHYTWSGGGLGGPKARI
jgi:hypothetical protein